MTDPRESSFNNREVCVTSGYQQTHVASPLGHQDIDNRVTDMYIKYNYSIIDESNRKVIDMVYSFKD